MNSKLAPLGVVQLLLPIFNELPAEGDFGGTMPVGDEPVMANAMEAIWQGMLEKTSNEFIGVEGHELGREDNMEVWHRQQVGLAGVSSGFAVGNRVTRSPRTDPCERDYAHGSYLGCLTARP
jgi:hypothetical protein